MTWNCAICTFTNSEGAKCLVCGAWLCEYCTCANESVRVECKACGLPTTRNNDVIRLNDSRGNVVQQNRNRKKPIPIMHTERALQSPEEKESCLFTCECETSDAVYCGIHDNLKLFQEFPARYGVCPDDVDDMRYIGSICNETRIFRMINGLRAEKLLSKTIVQWIRLSSRRSRMPGSSPGDHSLGDGIMVPTVGADLSSGSQSITFKITENISRITINKTIWGIELLGPKEDVMGRLCEYAKDTLRPVCMEVVIADATNNAKDSFGYYASHAAILCIIPPNSTNVGKIYLLDPNTNSSVANYKSADIEDILKNILPCAEKSSSDQDSKSVSFDSASRFEFVAQQTWLKGRSFDINGNYSDLGVSSGWCRTISVIIAGLVTNGMHPENVLPYLARQPPELRIMMYDSVIRHVVSHIMTKGECDYALAHRDIMRKKHADELKKVDSASIA